MTLSGTLVTFVGINWYYILTNLRRFGRLEMVVSTSSKPKRLKSLMLTFNIKLSKMILFEKKDV